MNKLTDAEWARLYPLSFHEQTSSNSQAMIRGVEAIIAGRYERAEGQP